MQGSTLFEMNAEWQRFLTAYPNLSIGLLSTCPTNATGIGASEISDPSYSRQTLSTHFAPPSNGQLQLLVNVVFPLLTTTQSIAGWALFDAVVGGNMLKFYCDGVAQTYIAGSQPQFLSGDIVLSKV